MEWTPEKHGILKRNSLCWIGNVNIHWWWLMGGFKPFGVSFFLSTYPDYLVILHVVSELIISEDSIFAK